MVEMHELDQRIKTDLTNRANQIEPSDKLFENIINVIEKRQERTLSRWNFRRKMTTIACGLLIIVSSTLITSHDARVMAKEVIKSIRTVFVMANDKVIEKPASQAYITPAIPKFSEESDSDISKKMGMDITFPQTIGNGYTILSKLEAIGFANPIDYDTYMDLKTTALKAIDNETIFNSLKAYKPYRSVGCNFKNAQGTIFSYSIYNKVVPIEQNDFMKISKSIQLKIGDFDATYFDISYPSYKNSDLTQKPVGETSGHILMWSKDNVMYQIATINQALAMKDMVDISTELIRK